jgi:hypothetical protein
MVNEIQNEADEIFLGIQLSKLIDIMGSKQSAIRAIESTVKMLEKTKNELRT